MNSGGNDGALRNPEFFPASQNGCSTTRLSVLLGIYLMITPAIRRSSILSTKRACSEYNLTVVMTVITTSEAFAAHMYGMCENLILGNYSMKRKTAAVL